ncbi:LysR family transcriptional regulator [Paraburkholderia aromaticivorans]|uniref:LysR family transcriptional regulator n=1 Tax=Paraburkholderia aromaticivorans TaxID=2026199 RepID=A0A248VL60_9BURK|nr:LysR family transcriptional regulator [Paraburkholderia aromaticivorans]ASV99149.1 LysR family transcriptional regulator [Paraburkholderia aromaticivorans]
MNQLQSMRVFVKVADLGSFVRAAGALDLSTAVVTRHVADLEARLGTRLLNRTTRRLSLTESGMTYLERVRHILDDLEGVEQMVVARNHEPVGTLRIVAPVVFGLHSLAPVVQSYAARYPEVVPDVTLADRHVDLVEEGFDVGILVARPMRSASIVMRRLTTGYMTVCATPAYLAQHGTPTRPEHLLAHPCLSRPSEQGGEERLFSGPDGDVRVRPTNAIVANNTEMLRQFALLGMGVAILPSYLIGRDLASGRLVPLLCNYHLPQIDITIAYPSRLHLPAKVRTFIDHLVEHFQPQGQQTRDPRARTQAGAASGAAEVMKGLKRSPEPELSVDADGAPALHKVARSRIVASSPF